jgi:glycosyltransferase involved in cell wall biosynthesis
VKIAISAAGKDWRGTDVVTWTLVTGFRQRGHEVLVLCRPGSILQQRLVDNGIPHAAILGGIDLSPAVLLRCVLALRRFRADVVLTLKDKDLRLSGVAARLLRIPVIVCHGTDRPLKDKPHYRFFFGRVATDHVAVSEAVRNTLIASAPWLKRSVTVIYNGVDIAAVDAAPSAALPVPAHAATVGFVGHFETRKGIIDFAQAWRVAAEQAREAHAVIVGEGRREPEFRAALHGAPRVHWLGFRSDVAAVMKSLDIFVLPSRFEGFGLVLVEAMAAGAACVAYDSSNMPEIITDGVDGVLVPTGDTAALAAAIVRVCQDAGLRSRLGAAARATAVQRFSADRMIRDYEAELLRIVEGVSRHYSGNNVTHHQNRS